MGFVPIARHRSREVTLFGQGAMNLIVNADPVAAAGQADAASGQPCRGSRCGCAMPATWQRALDLGAWDIPMRASAMELNIPGIRGVGDSQIYFVDRHGDYSIYDVDFEPASPTSRSSRRHWPACTISGSCRRSASTAPPTGPTSTASCWASRSCRKASISE